MNSIQIAHIIINSAFETKVDLNGKPYIDHLKRVASKFTDDPLRIVALLHDLLEDCPQWTEGALRNLFDSEIVDSIVALTKQKDQTYDSYIEQVKQDAWAVRVKLEDLKDNMDLSRFTVPIAKDNAMVDRLIKYQNAYTALLQCKSPLA